MQDAAPAAADVQPEAGLRDRKKEAKRAAIIAAAQAEFIAHGFAEARLARVAARAGVAKGTLYLYFDSKEALFDAVLRGALPLIFAPPEAADPGIPPQTAFRLRLRAAIADMQASGRDKLALIVLSESAQFPGLARIYLETILEPLFGLVRDYARSSGVARLEPLTRYPQLLLAPMLAATMWNRLMTERPPLDLPELLETHLTLVLGPPEGEAAPLTG